jgi:hypothetical protein
MGSKIYFDENITKQSVTNLLEAYCEAIIWRISKYVGYTNVKKDIHRLRDMLHVIISSPVPTEISWCALGMLEWIMKYNIDIYNMDMDDYKNCIHHLKYNKGAIDKAYTFYPTTFDSLISQYTKN